MNKDQHPVIAIKSILDWSNELTVGYREVFAALTEALTTLTKTDWDRRTQQTVASIKLKNNAPNAASIVHALFFRALTHTLFDLVQSVLHHLTRPDEQERARLVETLDYSFESLDLTIDARLLNEPESFPILEHIRRPLRQWLSALDLEITGTNTVMERLIPFFGLALDRERRLNIGDYESLHTEFQVPFTEPASLERSWLSYAFYLRKMTCEPYWVDAPFDGPQIPIPLRAFYFDRTEFPSADDDAGSMFSDYRRRAKAVVDLDQYLTDWVKRKNPDEDLKILTAISGCGMRHFIKKWSLDLLRSNAGRPLIIPLYDADVPGDLEESLGIYFTQTLPFTENPLHSAQVERPVLLIFHRLDNLPRSGAGLFENAAGLLRKIMGLLERYNKESLRLTALVYVWEPFVNELEAGLVERAQVIHALPLPPVAETDGLIDPQGLLAQDQRDLWWRLYGKAVGRTYDGLPRQLTGRGEIMDHLISIPLPSYMAASALDRGRLTLEELNDPDKLMDDSITNLHNHIFDDKRPYRWIYYLAPDRFIRALSETATAAWHEGWQRVSISGLEKRFLESGLADDLPAFLELVRSGLIDFFRLPAAESDYEPSGRERYFLFRDIKTMIHFGARRIRTELLSLREELERKDAFPYHGLDERAALLRWVRLCGPIETDAFFVDILIRQINYLGKEQAWELQKMIGRLFSVVLSRGLPLESIGGLTYRESERYARNAEAALLAAHYACAMTTKRQGRFHWPDKTSAGRWLKGRQGQSSGITIGIILNCLAYLDLDGSTLDGLDLRGANLKEASLRETSLKFALLAKADLKAVNLTKADLRHANLIEANLRQSQLPQADLRWADLSRADLHRAGLNRADLRRACLRNADLSEADLRGAVLKGADLHHADLEGADLHGADLRQARLTGVNLRRANLTDALLMEADLTSADLSWARLMDADFEATVLTEATGAPGKEHPSRNH